MPARTPPSDSRTVSYSPPPSSRSAEAVVDRLSSGAEGPGQRRLVLVGDALERLLDRLALLLGGLGRDEVQAQRAIAHSGMFPCRRFGRSTRFVCDIASASHSTRRVSDGRITSST